MILFYYFSYLQSLLKRYKQFGNQGWHDQLYHKVCRWLESRTHIKFIWWGQLRQRKKTLKILTFNSNCMFLLIQSDAVNFAKFREWLIAYPNSTSLTEWLLSDPCPITLSNDLETPTFYQTLSGVTHLDEQEIIDLEKKYWQLKSLSSNGKFDIQLFLSFTASPITMSSVEDDSKFTIAHGLFSAFDENCDGHLDFKEMVCGISAACRGPMVERIKCNLKSFVLC